MATESAVFRSRPKSEVERPLSSGSAIRAPTSGRARISATSYGQWIMSRKGRVAGGAASVRACGSPVVRVVTTSESPRRSITSWRVAASLPGRRVVAS